MHEDGAPASPTPVWASLSSRGGRADNQDRCGDAADADRPRVRRGRRARRPCRRVRSPPRACVEATLDAAGGGPGSRAASAVRPPSTPRSTPCRTRRARERRIARLPHDRGRARDRARPRALGPRRRHAALPLARRRDRAPDARPQRAAGAGADRHASAPEDIRRHPDRNRLLRSLGGEGESAPTLLDEAVARRRGRRLPALHGRVLGVRDRGRHGGGASRRRGPGRLASSHGARASSAAARGAFDNYSATAVILRPVRPGRPQGRRPPARPRRASRRARHARRCARAGGRGPLILGRLRARACEAAPRSAPPAHSAPPTGGGS